ncbi:hypothetical protein Hanom_Chr16g01476261 [Helianthus anomalus]
MENMDNPRSMHPKLWVQVGIKRNNKRKYQLVQNFTYDCQQVVYILYMTAFSIVFLGDMY